MFFLRFFYFLFFLNTLAANAFATSPEELLKKAQTLESNGFVEEATKSWEKLILVDTNRNLVIYSQLKLGMAYLKLKQLKKSIKILEGATLSYPDNFDAHFIFGNSLSSFKSFPEAIKSYQQTTTLKPKEGLSHVALSLSLFGNGDSKKAIKALLKANKLFKEKKNISWYRDTRVMIAQIKHFAKFPPHFSNLWLTTNLKLVHETYEKAVFNPKKYLPSASTN